MMYIRGVSIVLPGLGFDCIVAQIRQPRARPGNSHVNRETVSCATRGAAWDRQLLSVLIFSTMKTFDLQITSFWSNVYRPVLYL
jgi:hypothetical protein